MKEENMPENKKRVTVCLDNDVDKALEELAVIQRLSKSAIVNKILADNLALQSQSPQK